MLERCNDELSIAQCRDCTFNQFVAIGIIVDK
jgi:hypothetical protein